MISWMWLAAPAVAGAIIGAAGVRCLWVRWAERYIDRRLRLRASRLRRRSPGPLPEFNI